MKIIGKLSQSRPLSAFGISNTNYIYANLSPQELINQSLDRRLATLSDTGALVIKTGEFTGRSPDDKFTVDNEITHDAVDWNKFNKPFSQDKFEALFQKVSQYLSSKELFIQDDFACDSLDYQISVRVFAEYPWSAQFASNMFIRPSGDQLDHFNPDWCIYCAPGFKADPMVDGTRQHNFSIIDFKTKRILIGGSAYTGEIKKSIFTILNFVLQFFVGFL